MSKIYKLKLPPVSNVFYNNLIKYFPPIDSKDIKVDTCIIELQRKAGQQEVIKFISNYVVNEDEEPRKLSFLDKIKFLINS